MNGLTTLDVARAAGLKAGKVQGHQHLFLCPGHADREPSLSVNTKDNVFYCHPCQRGGTAWDLAALALGVSPDDKPRVIDWLRAKGLLPARSPTAGSGATPAAQVKAAPIPYCYTDERGGLLFEVLRYPPKTFRQRRPDGKGGYLWNLEGVTRVPYRLPDLLAQDEVWVVEGEKDVDRLRACGLTATTNPGGAERWTPDMARWFKKTHRVVVLPDNDDKGRAHARMVARSLAGRVASLKLLELPGLPDKGDVSDFLDARDPEAGPEELCRLAEGAPEFNPGSDARDLSTRFEKVGPGYYRMRLLGGVITFELDRPRRERHELIGQLTVKTTLPGAQTTAGALSSADFNVSSIRARIERAKLLAERARTDNLDWLGFVEEFSIAVTAADREGEPAEDLRRIGLPSRDDILVEGLALPRRHPTILFGDGGSAKSYLALFLAGRLVQQGLSVAYCDWEFAGEEHRDRLGRLFPGGMPLVHYLRCERALVHEADRVAKVVADQRVNFVVLDSVAFACDGPPESAEIAARFFQALRRFNLGSLLVAHVSKQEGSDYNPFGSIFWKNGARSVWYVKRSDEDDQDTLRLALLHRKSNLGRLSAPLGFNLVFEEQTTLITRADPAEAPDLAEKMTNLQRITHALKAGALTKEELADSTGIDPEVLRVTLHRHKAKLVVLPGGRVGLPGHHD